MATELTGTMNNYKEIKSMDYPLSESSVSIKLSLIQKRCSELMNETDGIELSLENPEPRKDNGDPYNHVK